MNMVFQLRKAEDWQMTWVMLLGSVMPIPVNLDLNCVCFGFHNSLKFKRYSKSLSRPIVDNQDYGRIYYDTDQQFDNNT